MLRKEAECQAKAKDQVFAEGTWCPLVDTKCSIACVAFIPTKILNTRGLSAIDTDWISGSKVGCAWRNSLDKEEV